MIGLKDRNSEKSSKDDVILSKLCFILNTVKNMKLKYLIPALGFYISVIDIFTYLYKSSKKELKGAILGLFANLLFTCLLFYILEESNSFKKELSSFTQKNFVRLDSTILLYKLKYNSLPDSLVQLNRLGITSIHFTDHFKQTIFKHNDYEIFFIYYKKIDSNRFLLKSVGIDRKENTKDDLIYYGHVK